MLYKDGETEVLTGDTVLGEKLKGRVVGFADAAGKPVALPAPSKDTLVGASAPPQGAPKNAAKVTVRSAAPWNPRKPSATTQTLVDPSTLTLLRRK